MTVNFKDVAEKVPLVDLTQALHDTIAERDRIIEHYSKCRIALVHLCTTLTEETTPYGPSFGEKLNQKIVNVMEIADAAPPEVKAKSLLVLREAMLSETSIVIE